MTPKQRYELDLQRPDFFPDQSQADAVEALERVFHEFSALPGAGAEFENTGLTVLDRFKSLLRLPSSVPEAPKVTGLYMWGGVGRGKTYLMDLFYDTLPTERKLRLHFHRFMRRVHQELTQLQGHKNPLETVANIISKDAVIICFDEFFVSDIGDAMILGGLFEALFERGVILVATSNIPPNELYKDGLQRARFIPAIEQITAHTQIMHLGGDKDYRLRALERCELYHYPLDDRSESNLAQYFSELVPGHMASAKEIEIEGRMISVRSVAEDVLWCDFVDLCDGPRSQNDYIEISRMYHAVILSRIPVLDAGAEDLARRFIFLVDELYDRNVKLIVSAEVSLEGLYVGERLQFEFERTKSRLLEMQSREYLEKGHRPD